MEANYTLSPDMQEALNKAQRSEESQLGGEILSMLAQNLKVA